MPRGKCLWRRISLWIVWLPWSTRLFNLWILAPEAKLTLGCFIYFFWSNFELNFSCGRLQFHSASFSEANLTSKTDLEVILSIFVLPPVSLCLFSVLLLSLWFSEAERIWIYGARCRKKQTKAQFFLCLVPARLTLDHPHRQEKRHSGECSDSPLEGAPDWSSEGHCTKGLSYKMKLSVDSEDMT